MKQSKHICMIIIVMVTGFLLASCNTGGTLGVDPSGLIVINISAIPGVVPPFTGQTPKASINETTQYTGTITWSPEVPVFVEGDEYTATITLTAKSGYTLEGVGSDFFTIAGATNVSNEVNSGIITVEFPATAFGVIFDPDNSEELIYQKLQIGDYATPPTGVKKHIDSIDINSLNTAGLYIRQLTLLGWYRDDVEYDFSVPIGESIILKAKWSDIPTPISSVAANDIAAAVDYSKANPDEYLLLLSTDVNSAPQTINVTNTKLVLAGIGKEQKISLSSNGTLFTIGAIGRTGIELTLGKNITLTGRTSGVDGASVNNNSNLVVVQSGASFTMLKGSKITGNTSSSTIIGYDSALRVTGMESSFTMQGGTIIGNSGIENSADVYIDNNIAASGFRLSGHAKIGALTLNANSTAYAYPVIAADWAGNINKLNLRGNNSSIDIVKTYWEEKIIIETEGGYILSTADITKFKLGDFISSATSNNIEPIINSHYLGNSGWLLKNGTDLNVLLSKNYGPTREYIYLDHALNSIIHPGHYIVTIKTDFDLAPRTINTSGVKITFIGADTERKINLSENGRLFTVGASGSSGIELTLGKNITLVGRTNEVNGATSNNNNNLVLVQNGASFSMLKGSKITGNTFISNSSTNGFGASVHVKGTGSSFKMQGGIVSENTGGNGNADVYIGAENAGASGLTLSGNAQIGSLIMSAVSGYSGSPTVYASAAIASGWTGSIAKLDLGSDSTSNTTTISYWLYREVIKEAEGHTISSSDIGKITLGNFLFGFSPYTQSISDTHYLYSTGQLFNNGEVHTVWVSRNGGKNLGYPNLSTGLSFIGAGDNTITILENQTIEPPNNGNSQGRLISTSGANVIFVSPDVEKTISIAARRSFMFTVRGSDVALTLGNNITLVGFSKDGNGGMDNNEGLVEVTNGASFTMLPGSKVTGNTSMEKDSGAAVSVSNSTFYMKGGEISGNARAFNGTTYIEGGGVSLFNSSLIMEGGSIKGNSGNNGIGSDISKNTSSSIILSGDAEIGIVIMTASSIDNNNVIPITIAQGWSGSGARLNLFGNSSVIDPYIINSWVDKKVLQPASGYTLTSTDINRFTLGHWLSYVDGTTLAIDAHKISEDGVIVPE